MVVRIPFGPVNAFFTVLKALLNAVANLVSRNADLAVANLVPIVLKMEVSPVKAFLIPLNASSNHVANLESLNSTTASSHLVAIVLKTEVSPVKAFYIAVKGALIILVGQFFKRSSAKPPTHLINEKTALTLLQTALPP